MGWRTGTPGVVAALGCVAGVALVFSGVATQASAAGRTDAGCRLPECHECGYLASNAEEPEGRTAADMANQLTKVLAEETDDSTRRQAELKPI